MDVVVSEGLATKGGDARRTLGLSSSVTILVGEMSESSLPRGGGRGGGARRLDSESEPRRGAEGAEGAGLLSNGATGETDTGEVALGETGGGRRPPFSLASAGG